MRQMWLDGVNGWQANGWGKLEYRFVLSREAENETHTVKKHLDEELEEFGDLTFEDCKEGYLEGMLTAKVLASMKTYLNSTSPPDLFMKIDDDTFVEFSRLRGILRQYLSKGGDLTKVFMGVFVRNNDTLAYHQGIPCRDPSSAWYEPTSTFKEEYYPVAAQGGPGYILSKQMVERIVYDGIAERNMLSIEDKAVAVWVDRLIAQGLDVDFVDIPGTNGYAVLDHWLQGAMFQYPFVLHHHLDGRTIGCLHRVSMAKNRMKIAVDKCNFGSTEFFGADSACNDGRHGADARKSHEVIIEGWASMRWKQDETGDQLPIVGSTRILTSWHRHDKKLS